MEICIKTLTPLWTGGVDGTMDRIHETGFTGSLRWWYEAIVRGLGGWACDREKSPCQLTGSRPDDPLPRYKQAIAAGKTWWDALDEAGICDACKVFGTTGWRRRFQVRIAERQPENEKDTGRTVNIRPYGRQRGWYLPLGWEGRLRLDVSGDPIAVGQLATLFLFLERWGGLGAKPQLGYGAFRIENRRDLQSLVRTLSPTLEIRRSEQFALPSLRAMTFFRVHFIPRFQNWWENVDGLRQVRKSRDRQVLQKWARSGAVPVGPTIKNDWRYAHSWPSPHLKPWLFGTLRKDHRIRSKVNIGWAIRRADGSWLIRGWVWLPRDGVSRAGYTTLVNTMRTLVEDGSRWLDMLDLRGRVRRLDVEIFPPPTPWGIKSASDIQTWLGEVLEDEK